MTDFDTKTIERRIQLAVPNTIGLDSEQWDKRPVSFHVQEIPLYCGWLAGLSVIPLLIFLPFSVGVVLLWIGIAVLVLSAGFFTQRIFKRKHRENQLSYRKKFAPAVVELLEANGFEMSMEEQRSLATSMKTKLKVQKNGIAYRSSGLEAYGNTIFATFLLVDVAAKQALVQAEYEQKIQDIVSLFEAENGEFASPELRDAFVAGVRQSIR